MSTIWTPDGEKPIGTSRPAASEPTNVSGERVEAQPSDAESAEQMEALRQELLGVPAEMVIANHCFGLFELAALHLGTNPPNLEQARTAIDAFACLVEGMGNRLGDNEPSLKEGLSQIRLAFVQISQAAQPSGSESSESTASQPGS